VDLLTAILLILAGGVAGFINAVAGGGSAITLPVLEGMLGATTANGTNRIAVLLANATAVAGFSKGGAMPWRQTFALVPPTIVGAAAGAWTATQISNDGMKRVFAFVLVFVAISVLVKPSRWTTPGEGRALPQPWRSLVFLGAGFYGGFVQAGAGFLLLLGLVMGQGFDLIRGNAAKVLLILIYTPVALIFFAGASQVDLFVGLILAIGNSSGAWIASRLAVKKGAGWIRWLLVVVAIGAAIRMLLT
jgi:uncharacterized membrane protein YfcA